MSRPEPEFLVEGADEPVGLARLISENIFRSDISFTVPELHQLCTMSVGEEIIVGGGAFTSMGIERTL